MGEQRGAVVGCRREAVDPAVRAQEPLDALAARLTSVLDWLKDPRLSQWPYMENGDFYDDLSDQIREIEQTLGTTVSATDRCKHGVWAADHCYQCAAETVSGGANETLTVPILRTR